MDYEKLYQACYMQVYSYVMTLAKNRELAEEITQDTFYRAMSARSSFRRESSELTWLCSIARNLFYDEMRRHRRSACLPQSVDAAAEDDVENTVVNRDTAYRIYSVLHGLEDPYREVFSLRVFGELPFAQIASIFGKTESWARVTYHRARLKVRERMEDNHE